MDENREYATTIEQRIKIMELAVEALKNSTPDNTLDAKILSKRLINVYTTMYNLINPKTNQSNE